MPPFSIRPKSGFKRLPTEMWQQQGPLLLG